MLITKITIAGSIHSYFEERKSLTGAEIEVGYFTPNSFFRYASSVMVQNTGALKQVGTEVLISEKGRILIEIQFILQCYHATLQGVQSCYKVKCP